MATIPRSVTPSADPKEAVPRNIAIYMMGGFSPAKTRRLLETIPGFNSVDCPEYSALNLVDTFHKLRTANRDAEQGDPYMALIMTCATPFNLRRQANAAFDVYFPVEAAKVNEEAELEEMGRWEARWREEIRLLKRSPFSDFRDKAEGFEKDLGEYTKQLKREDQSEHTRKGFGHSPKRGRPEKKADRIVVQDIPRPSLKLITGGGRLSPARKTGEGVATPGKAQHLDSDGYFSPRPKTPSRTPPKTPSRTPPK